MEHHLQDLTQLAIIGNGFDLRIKADSLVNDEMTISASGSNVIITNTVRMIVAAVLKRLLFNIFSDLLRTMHYQHPVCGQSGLQSKRVQNQQWTDTVLQQQTYQHY